MNIEPKKASSKDEPISKGKVVPKKRNRSGNFFIGFIVFVIVVVLVLLIAVSREIRQSNKIVIAINKLATEQGQVTLQLQGVAQQLESHTNQISINQRAIGEIQKLVTHDVNRWRCQKAEYLIRMADLTLRLQRDIPLSTTLLKAADDQLKDQPQNKFLKVRRLLAHNIKQLNKVSHIDIEEIYIQLQKIDRQVEKLPLISASIESNDEQHEEAPVDEDRSIWMRGLMASWGAISKVLVIHHSEDEAVEPLISPKQRKFLDLNLHVLFAQAQWALLRHQSKIYLITLDQIEALINHYFAKGDQATQQMLTHLTKLKKEATLTFRLPNVHHTLAVFKSINCDHVKKTRLKEASSPAQRAI